MIPLCPVPLWHRLEDESQEALISYQRENYGLEIEIPPEPLFIESLEEIERIMREVPKHQVKVN